MTSKPKYAGLGIALGAALGAAFGVVSGNTAVWLAVGVAVGLALGTRFHRKPVECSMCEEMHSSRSIPEQKDGQ